jgi:uncharacterized membrane protein YsdA (DUF1294 family)
VSNDRITEEKLVVKEVEGGSIGLIEVLAWRH